MTSNASLFSCRPADVTLARVRELVGLGQPESLTLEYKESYTSRIAESVAAMANSYGGVILIGMTERNVDDRLTGVAEPEIVKIVNGCHQTLEPPWVPEIIPVPLPDSQDRMILVVRVDPAKAPRRPMLVRGAAPIRLHGRNAVADFHRLTELINESAPPVGAVGRRLPVLELPRDEQGAQSADFALRTGMFVPVDASATWQPLSEQRVDSFIGALNSSPLHQSLFRWCTSYSDGEVNAFHRNGFNRARNISLLWRGGPRGVQRFPIEAVATLHLPDSFGAQVSHLQVSLQVRSRFSYALERDGVFPLPVSRLYELVDALVATTADGQVRDALAALAGIDPLAVPQAIGLDFVSPHDVVDLLKGRGLTRIPEAGTSRGANLLADPGVDQHDPDERRALVDGWLQQISLDAGLLGMERLLAQLHAQES